MTGFVCVTHPPEPDAEQVGHLPAGEERGGHDDLLETVARPYVVLSFRFSSPEVKTDPGEADVDVVGGIKKGSSQPRRRCLQDYYKPPQRPTLPLFSRVFRSERLRLTFGGYERGQKCREWGGDEVHNRVMNKKKVVM